MNNNLNRDQFADVHEHGLYTDYYAKRRAELQEEYPDPPELTHTKEA